MLPGMKHLIEIYSSNRIGQTIVRPARSGSVITASSGTSTHLLSRRHGNVLPLIPNPGQQRLHHLPWSSRDLCRSLGAGAKRVAERLLQMIADQWLLGRLCSRDRGAKWQSRVRLPEFFNRDCDDNGSGFGRSPYEMRRRMCSSR
jgi:hypothetical protein